MEQCRQCGGGPVQGGWCRTCGMPASFPTAGPPPAATREGRPAPWHTEGSPRAGGTILDRPVSRAQAMPVLLWAAIGALALAAVLCLTTLIGTLANADALSTDELEVLASAAGSAAPGFGLVGAVWLGLAAWFVALGSRPARAFALIGAVLGLCALVSGLLVIPLAAAALLAAGAAVVLVVVPDARAWFSGPYARVLRGPVSVLLVRTCSLGAAIAWMIGTVGLGVFGLIALAGGLVTASGGARSELGAALGGLLGVIGGFVLIAALFCAALAAVQFWVFSALARTGPRSPRPARVVATVLAGLAGLGALLTWDRWTLLGLAVAAVLIGALWVPDDARRHFGDAPLPAVARLVARVRAIGGPAGVRPGAAPPARPTVQAAPAGWPPEPEEAWSRQDPTSGTVCALCGTPVAPGSSFCGNCGTRI
ncbi:zinc ribbon domain-containing protein [Actinomycetospora termitidis]|uniref:Zinc ribbon domain-containing protein n=1 Tax=Actinomycetospora termitidis TaxID=3053470 RepID=A0ABT7MGU2_9PSEU|nr:zinc ribbon domain-containing protein [Actinomycetospora sp. Odt1-22]MDL5159162.1 zinc ribbon domain-containing protein [Actinomycetospora sp. Odt1-22]